MRIASCKGVQKLALALLAMLLCSSSAFAQYGGPSILSRGGNQPGRRGRAPVNFTAHFGTSTRYETGLLIPAKAGSDNLVPTTDDTGYSVEGGLYGGHDWRRQSIGVDYRGDYRWQQSQTQFNGTNHVLAFDYVARVGKRLQFTLRESGGTTNRAFGSFAAPAFADSSRQGVPISELFDVRTYFAQSGLSASWMKSPRFQVTAQIDAFFLKRKSFALINSQGYNGSANAMYRLDRSTYVGAEYQFFSFEFPRAYSKTGAQGPGIRIRRKIGRSINIEGHGGLIFINSTGTEQVQLSPEVAAILGRTTSPASFIRDSIAPNVDVNATIQQSRGAVRIGFSNGIGAGNGVYLATTRTTANAGYSYSGVKRASLGISGSWTRTSSASLTLNSFEGWQIGGGASYVLREGFNLTSNLDYRSFSGIASQSRTGISFSFGLAYSTSRLPLSIW
ncbi:MAG: hypothetical protein SGI92_17020 [Bryobacteraceae bacterium]|nr:hypothetical protein [Bryobacteraceae bacterium]